MSAQRRRDKAAKRQANVHNLGICGGPARCPLRHSPIFGGGTFSVQDPTTGEWNELRGIRSLSIGRSVDPVAFETALSYRGRGA